MSIEQFVARSEGQWRSMRSGHALAFRQFEDVISTIKIERLAINNQEVANYLALQSILPGTISSPFQMTWQAESDWEPDDASPVSQGTCILIPIAETERTGHLLRSTGYAESEPAVSSYNFLDDGTFILKTVYSQSMAEERIWFLSEHVRCRSSVLRTSEGSGILQTSFSSEIRKIEA
jgi:phycoerythrin-associated linker protein